jgi:hypothetical protein
MKPFFWLLIGAALTFLGIVKNEELKKDQLIRIGNQTVSLGNKQQFAFHGINKDRRTGRIQVQIVTQAAVLGEGSWDKRIVAFPLSRKQIGIFPPGADGPTRQPEFFVTVESTPKLYLVVPHHWELATQATLLNPSRTPTEPVQAVIDDYKTESWRTAVSVIIVVFGIAMTLTGIVLLLRSEPTDPCGCDES